MKIETIGLELVSLASEMITYFLYYKDTTIVAPSNLHSLNHRLSHT